MLLLLLLLYRDVWEPPLAVLLTLDDDAEGVDALARVEPIMAAAPVVDAGGGGIATWACCLLAILFPIVFDLPIVVA